MFPQDGAPFPRSFRLQSGGSAYVGPEEATTHGTMLSELRRDGYCGYSGISAGLGEAIEVPEVANFEPPYEVITRADYMSYQ